MENTDINFFFNNYLYEPNTKKKLIRLQKFEKLKYKKILNILKKKLSTLFHFPEKDIFWERVMGQFVLHHTHQCAKFFLSKKFRNIFYINFKTNFVPINQLEYREILQVHKEGSEKLLLLLLKHRKLKYKMNNKLGNKPNKKNIKSLTVLNFINSNLRKIVYSICKPKVLVSDCFWGKKKKLKIMFKSLFNIFPYTFQIINKTSSETDGHLRSLIFNYNGKDKFLSYFFSSLSNFFPKSLLEDFNFRKKYCKNFLNKNKKLKFIINESMSEDQGFLMAFASLKNIKLIYSEHNFLQYFYIGNTIDLIAKKFDLFFTIGWKRKKTSIYKNKFISCGSFFNFFISREKKIKFNILYLPGPAERVSYYSSGSQGINGVKFSEDYINNTLFFFQNIKKEVLKEIHFKPYNNYFSNGFNENKNIKKISEFLSKNDAKLIEKNISGREAISRCNLLITDYLSTPYLQGIFSNIPTIVLHTKNYFFINKFKKIFSDFYKFNIFHTDPIHASNFLNKIYPNHQNWWSQKHIQVALNKFKVDNYKTGDYYEEYLKKYFKKNVFCF